MTYGFNPSTNRKHRFLTALAALAAILAVGFALTGGAAGQAATTNDTQIGNETVNVTDPANQSVYVDAEFATTGTSEITAYVYNTSGVEIGNVTLNGTAGEVDTGSIAVSETGNHTVEIYAADGTNESDLSGLWVSLYASDDGTTIISGGGGGSGDGSSSSDSGALGGAGPVEIGVALAALVTLLGAVAKVRS